MISINLKRRIAENQILLGSWITLSHPAIAEIMAYAGFDWLVIDLEHSVITIGEAEVLLRTIGSAGVAPLVRLTSNDADQIKRVMDAGATGIVVPMVKSRQDSEAAVAAVYYPPRGTRGVGLARAQGYGASFEDYRAWLEEEAVVIVQIEHIAAVNDIEAILSVDGVDGFIIGPYDLSASLGVPGQFSHPDVVSALERVEREARRLGKPGGFHVVESDPEALARHVRNGYRFLGYSLDIRLLDVGCRTGLAAISDLLK
jgi:2-dehydro-3-deoxyglucarate aldolase